MATVDRAPRTIPTAGLGGVMQAAQWMFNIHWMLGSTIHWMLGSTSLPTESYCEFALGRLEFAKDEAAQYEFFVRQQRPTHAAQRWAGWAFAGPLP